MDATVHDIIVVKPHARAHKTQGGITVIFLMYEMFCENERCVEQQAVNQLLVTGMVKVNHIIFKSLRLIFWLKYDHASIS